MKKIIFYQPIYNFKKSNPNSGTLVRPKRMKEAFTNIGYEVIDINGSFENRNKLVDDALKENILFAYFESNNTPLFLTCKNDKKLDFVSDIKNIKKIKQKMKLGYYYRDNFWVESSYFKKVGLFKGIFFRICFFFEYLILIKLVDIMFVQSEEMINSFPFSKKYKNKFKLLPPACEEKEIDQFEYNSNTFNILYSGACDDYSKYNILPFLSTIKDLKNTHFYINSNFAEELFNKYPYLNNINNISKMDLEYDRLDKHPQKYGLGIIYLYGKNKDINKYLPIKAFYYLSLGLPILAQSNTATGNFIKEYNLGWTYDSLDNLPTTIDNIKNNPEELIKKHNNVIVFRKNQRWTNRTQYVEKTLS